MNKTVYRFLNDNYDDASKIIDVVLHRTIEARTDARCVTEEDYEDFKNDAMLRILKYSDSYDMNEKIGNWVATIAVNNAKDVLGTRASHGRAVSIDTSYKNKEGDSVYKYETPSDDCTNYEAEYNSQVETLTEYASHCSKLQRKIVELTLKGFKSGEIAEELGLESKRIQEEKSRFVNSAKKHFARERYCN